MWRSGLTGAGGLSQPVGAGPASGGDGIAGRARARALGGGLEVDEARDRRVGGAAGNRHAAAEELDELQLAVVLAVLGVLAVLVVHGGKHPPLQELADECDDDADAVLALVGVDEDRVVGGVRDNSKQVVELGSGGGRRRVAGGGGREVEVERHVHKAHGLGLALDPAVVVPVVGLVADVDDGAELERLEEGEVDDLRVAAAVEVALDDAEVERREVAGLAGKDLERRVVAAGPPAAAGGSAAGSVRAAVRLAHHRARRRRQLQQLQLRVQQLVLVRLPRVHPLPVLVLPQLLEYLLALRRHRLSAAATPSSSPPLSQPPSATLRNMSVLFSAPPPLRPAPRRPFLSRSAQPVFFPRTACKPKHTHQSGK